jgi:hypothetical protein
VNLNDYIQGTRHGAGAHDLELEAMRDPLLADALDGYNAVAGDHAGALGSLAGRVRHSATGGRASARSRASRQFERRVRGWSTAVAVALMAGVVAGGVWLFGSEVPADETHTATLNVTPEAEVEPYLPAVSVERAPALPTAMDGARLGRDEVRSLAANDPRLTEYPNPSDTTTTTAFRRHARSKGVALAGPNGAVLVLFEVGTGGRPRVLKVTGAPTTEAAEAAGRLVDEGPDWPAQPETKLITIYP